MDPLLLVAQRLNLRTDGTDRATALAILVAVGTDPAGPCAEDDARTIAERSDGYVIGRARAAGQIAARHADAAAARHADAATFGTVRRTDCGCHADAAPAAPAADPERCARDRMARANRTAWAEGSEHADSAEAVEKLRAARKAPVPRPAPKRKADAAPTSEADARKAMQAASRNAYKKTPGKE